MWNMYSFIEIGFLDWTTFLAVQIRLVQNYSEKYWHSVVRDIEISNLLLSSERHVSRSGGAKESDVRVFRHFIFEAFRAVSASPWSRKGSRYKIATEDGGETWSHGGEAHAPLRNTQAAQHTQTNPTWTLRKEENLKIREGKKSGNNHTNTFSSNNRSNPTTTTNKDP